MGIAVSLPHCESEIPAASCAAGPEREAKRRFPRGKIPAREGVACRSAQKKIFFPNFSIACFQLNFVLY
jgi:hypothetical protein